MVTMMQKAFPLGFGAAAALAITLPTVAAAQNTFGGQPVTLPAAVEVATPKKTSNLTVSATGRTGTYRSIRQAVAAAEAGDTIRIETGEYNEPGLVLDKSLNIHGVRSGSLMPLIRVSQPGASCMTQTSSNVTTSVSDVILVASDSSSPCINVTAGRFELARSRVLEAQADPLRAAGGHAGSYTGNLVPTSLVSISGGSVVLTGNEIRGGRNAIAVSQAANLYNTDTVRLEGNTITGGDQHGVLVEGSANLLEISGNMITNNGQAGIYNDGNWNTRFVGNTITGNRDDGIYVGENARHTTLESNEISSNVGDGLEVHGGMITILAGNNIARGGDQRCAVRDGVTGNKGGGAIRAHTDIAQGIFNDTSGQTAYRGRTCDDNSRGRRGRRSR
ncbi:MAG: right-handed parallel beta-helix repeat-containing protein [Pseudomonadota bacterium]